MTEGTQGLHSCRCVVRSRLAGVKMESPLCPCERPQQNLTILRGTSITGVVLHESEPQIGAGFASLSVGFIWKMWICEPF